MPVFESSGLARDVILVLNFGVVFYTLLFAAVLIGRWIKDSKRTLLDIRLVWGVFLIGMSLNTLLFAIGDFYFNTEPAHTFWTKAGYMAMMLALVAFFFVMERVLPYRTGHVFSICGILSAALIIVFPRRFIVYLTFAMSLVTIIGFVLFIIYTRSGTTGDARRDTTRMTTGFLLAIVGFLGRSDFVYNSLGESVYLSGIALYVIGLAIFGYVMISSPAMEEFDWRTHLIRLYVINKGGVLVYYHHFVDIQVRAQELTAAGISGIQSLMQEAMQSDAELNHLSIGDYEILFAHSDDSTCVLLCTKPYRVLLHKVIEFSNLFQDSYGPELRSFGSDITPFKSASDIVDALF